MRCRRITISKPTLTPNIKAAGIGDQAKSPLFRSAAGRTDMLTDKAMNRVDAWRMVQRRAADLGMRIKVGCHTFRARLPPTPRSATVASPRCWGSIHRLSTAIDRTQPGPDLPVSFAGPRGSLEVGADGGEQRLVADAGLGSAARRSRRRRDGAGLRLARGIKGGARLVPDLADPGHAIATAGGRGSRLGHHRDLLRAKGPGRPILARSSSTSMLSSPMRCMAAASSPLAGSLSRSFSAPSMAASAFSRHCSSL